jgi:hypothetical protein
MHLLYLLFQQALTYATTYSVPGLPSVLREVWLHNRIVELPWDRRNPSSDLFRDLTIDPTTRPPKKQLHELYIFAQLIIASHHPRLLQELIACTTLGHACDGRESLPNNHDLSIMPDLRDLALWRMRILDLKSKTCMLVMLFASFVFIRNSIILIELFER